MLIHNLSKEIGPQEKLIRLAEAFLSGRYQEKERSYYDGVCERVLREQFSILLWKYSEASGKYQGCLYWSMNARQQVEERGLRHDHLVPRKVLINLFFGLESVTYEAVKELFEKFCIGVVITSEEDKRLNEAKLRQCMPQGEEWKRNPWLRYGALTPKIIIDAHDQIPVETKKLLNVAGLA